MGLGKKMKMQSEIDEMRDFNCTISHFLNQRREIPTVIRIDSTKGILDELIRINNRDTP